MVFELGSLVRGGVIVIMDVISRREFVLYILFYFKEEEMGVGWKLVVVE